MRVRFADGYVLEQNLPIDYSFGGGLSVDLSRASADLQAHTLTVSVSEAVDTAEITAFGARKKLLDKSVVQVDGGPGDITLPWVGDPSDVVLLEVKVQNAGAWAGFEFSPWFLDIPHDDVLFESGSDVIDPDQEYKLEATLQDLNEVIEKYGEVVPVKLYIAGCTDTVGDGAGNRQLSQRRARDKCETSLRKAAQDYDALYDAPSNDIIEGKKWRKHTAPPPASSNDLAEIEGVDETMLRETLITNEKGRGYSEILSSTDRAIIGISPPSITLTKRHYIMTSEDTYYVPVS